MKTLTPLLCLKCPNVFPPHSHWVKVPIMASKVLSSLDYLSDLSFSHLSSDTEGISHPGLLVLSWTLQEHLKPPSQQCGILLQILARATPSLLWISAKMSRSSPHHHGLPCLCCLIFPCSSGYHDFYIFHQCSIFICLLSDSPSLPNNTLEYKLLGVNRIFLCFVHCCLSSTWDDTWSMSDRKVFVEWLGGWTFL